MTGRIEHGYKNIINLNIQVYSYSSTLRCFYNFVLAQQQKKSRKTHKQV